MNTNIKALALSDITIDANTCGREFLSNDAIADYAEAISNGAKFPPVTVFHDVTTRKTYLADGFHTFYATKKAGRPEIECDYRDGSIHNARLFAASANRLNGVHRSRLDKRHCVAMLLADPVWGRRSSRWIAKHSGTSHTFVDGIRIVPTGNVASDETREGRDGREQRVGERQDLQRRERRLKMADDIRAEIIAMPTQPPDNPLGSDHAVRAKVLIDEWKEIANNLLETSTSISECQAISDQAFDIQQWSAECRIRLERKMGQLLNQIEQVAKSA